jgi:hypothetical protein
MVLRANVSLFLRTPSKEQYQAKVGFKFAVSMMLTGVSVVSGVAEVGSVPI